MRLRLETIAHQVHLFLIGHLSRTQLSQRVSELHRAYGGKEASSSSSPAAVTILGLLGIILNPAQSISPQRLKVLLVALEARLRSNQPARLRRFVPRVFGELGPLRLCAVDNPLEFESRHEAWVDVGLLQPTRTGRKHGAGKLEEDVRLIPFSVFTRGFFQDELPQFFSGPRTDELYYHPENDQALFLQEKYPLLTNLRLQFQYFVDETGLAEIVLDTNRIGRGELVFAAQLFCLRNGVRRATLDGRRVVGTPVPPPC